MNTPEPWPGFDEVLDLAIREVCRDYHPYGEEMIDGMIEELDGDCRALLVALYRLIQETPEERLATLIALANAQAIFDGRSIATA